MEDAARKRKERLLALKAKLQNGAESSQNDTSEPSGDRLSTDRAEKRPRDSDDVEMNGDIENNSHNPTTIKPVTVEDEAEQIQEELKEQIKELETAEIDIFQLASKKPDWDLKRDAEKKMEKLNKITQRKIAELVRIRLQSNGRNKEDNLAEAVRSRRLEDEDSD